MIAGVTIPRRVGTPGGLGRVSGWDDRVVTVIKINAITVPADSGDELARRFAARAGAVDNQEGFEGFELLKPTDGRTTWLVVTRWRDEESFQAWMHSPAFEHGHRSAAERAGGEAPHPVGISSELWSYDIAGGSAGHSR
jgi:heme oxygenase (mycobilin-producing)